MDDVTCALIRAAREAAESGRTALVRLTFGEWEVSYKERNAPDLEDCIYLFLFRLPGGTTYMDTHVEREDGYPVDGRVGEIVNEWYELLTVENKLCL